MATQKVQLVVYTAHFKSFEMIPRNNGFHIQTNTVKTNTTSVKDEIVYFQTYKFRIAIS